jgi:hypothetical protein
MPRSGYRGLPMTLGNMRANGVRSLAVSCLLCRQIAVLAVESSSLLDHGTVCALDLSPMVRTAGLLRPCHIDTPRI